MQGLESEAIVNDAQHQGHPDLGVLEVVLDVLEHVAEVPSHQLILGAHLAKGDEGNKVAKLLIESQNKR